MAEYIDRQDAIDIVVFECGKWTGLAKEISKQLKQLPAADVVPVETLKAEIYKLKCQQDCKNQDYYTGYMSALSTVEGILAEMGEE